MTTTDYRPIACASYSELEVLALRGTSVELRLHGPAQTLRGRIRDLLSERGVEYLLLQQADGLVRRVRLDRLISVRSLGDRPS